MTDDAPRPDPEEESFAKSVREGVRQLRAERGPCPSADDLTAFHDGRLSIEEIARVRNHVEACGLCDVQLARLASDKPAKRPVSTWVWAFFRRPVVPYALVALLLFPAYRGFVPRRKDYSPEPSASPRGETELLVAPIPSFSLDVVRSSSGVQKSPIIRLSRDDRFFLLSFLVPIKAPPSYRYNLSVVREDETAVVSPQMLRDCDGVGNCYLICNTALFPTGRYEVGITETGPASTTVTRHFPFEIVR
jgi:hypothetical protein